MSPEAAQLAIAAAPEIYCELVARGLEELIVKSDDIVYVRSSVAAHDDVPVPLHDVDDVRWFAHEVAETPGDAEAAAA